LAFEQCTGVVDAFKALFDRVLSGVWAVGSHLMPSRLRGRSKKFSDRVGQLGERRAVVVVRRETVSIAIELPSKSR